MQQKIILLEGPDGAGKSTTGVLLAKKISGVYIHNNQYSKIDYGIDLVNLFYHQMIYATKLSYQMDTSVKKFIPIILDRSWISEMIYGQVYRLHPRIEQLENKFLTDIFNSLNSVVVNFRPPLDIVLSNFQSNIQEQLLQNTQDLEKIYNMYSTSNLQTYSNVIIEFDYTTQILDELVNKLEKYWKSL